MDAPIACGASASVLFANVLFSSSNSLVRKVRKRSVKVEERELEPFPKVGFWGC